MNTHIKSHRAIAMIELIFAIVIMAIVLLSAPNLISQSTKSSYVGLQQESINAAATHLNIIMTKEWDHENAVTNVDSRVLVANGVAALNEVGTTNRRAGVPTTSFRKFVTGIGNSQPASPASEFGEGEDNVSLDDVDDYDGHLARLKEVNTTNAAKQTDYKDRFIEMNTTVRYVSDATTSGNYNTDARITFDNPFAVIGAGTTNIKAISVTLTTDTSQTGEELAKEITLSAFMCNIGHYQFAPFKDVP